MILFIDGMDGSGKTTAINKIMSLAKKRDIKTKAFTGLGAEIKDGVLSYQGDNVVIANEIRNNKLSPSDETEAVTLLRKRVYGYTNEAIANGTQLVIIDRDLITSLAEQSMSKEQRTTLVSMLRDLENSHGTFTMFLKPQLSVIKERLAMRTNRDAKETAETAKEKFMKYVEAYAEFRAMGFDTFCVSDDETFEVIVESLFCDFE